MSPRDFKMRRMVFSPRSEAGHMNRTFFKLGTGLWLTIMTLLHAGPALAASTPTLLVESIKPPPLHENERVTSFDVELRGARVWALPNLPMGWLVRVNNDPSWETSVSGSIIVGAAGLEPNAFSRFFVIEKYAGAQGAIPFSIRGRFGVMSYGSAKLSTRTIALPSNQFVSTPR